MTSGIQEIGDEAIKVFATQVGAFDHDGQRIFWKIDYYGPDIMSGSEDPSDPDATRRVLSIIRASEY
ncbi:MAG: DUF3768 domain-containing protein [Pseudomonadota bacterium]